MIPITTHDLVTVTLAALLITALGPWLFRRDPERRRRWLLYLAALLVAMPWRSIPGMWGLPIGMPAAAAAWLQSAAPTPLIMLWWTVAMALMVRTALGAFRTRRWLRQLPPIDDRQLIREARDLACSMGCTRTFELRTGPAACVSSLGMGVVVLPDVASGWSRSTRIAVLAHELTHLRRLDDRYRLALRLLCDWYWWLPGLRPLFQRYSDAMEESCDELACRHCSDRTDYVAGIVDAVRSLHARPGARTSWAPSPALAAMGGPSALARRADRLLTRPRPSLDHADGGRLLATVCLIVTVLLIHQPTAMTSARETARPAVPISMNADTRLDEARHPTGGLVIARAFLRNPDTSRWFPLPDSVRFPKPLYPMSAFEQGIQGTVRLEFPVTTHNHGVAALGSPIMTSSDASGILAAATRRSLQLTGAPRTTVLPGAWHPAAIWPQSLAAGTGHRLRIEFRFLLRDPHHPPNDGG